MNQEEEKATKNRKNFVALTKYSNGYTQALHDIVEWFESHSDKLSYFRMFNKKSIMALLKAIEQNHEIFEEYGRCVDFKISHQDKNIITFDAVRI